MNGFSGNWSPKNNGADFPGFGFGFTDMDFIRADKNKSRFNE